MKRLLMLSISFFAVGVSGAESVESLIGAHLQQSESVNDRNAQEDSNGALADLKAQIERSRLHWEEKVQSGELVESALLQGIPTGAMSQARAMAADGTATEAALKNEVHLDLLIALASLRNPDAKVAYEKLRATLRHYEQASYLEDLLSQYRAFVRELDTKVGPQTNKEMSASFFPSSLALKGQVVDEEAEIARLEYVTAVRKAMNDAARGFFMVQYTARAIGTVRESRNLFSEIEKSTRQQLEAGQATRADALKAKSMLTTLDNQLRTLQHTLHHHIADVNTALGLRPDAEWGTFIEADLKDDALPLDKALSLAATQSQESQQAGKDVELMRTMVRMAETMIYPRASAGMSQLAPSMGAEAGPTRDTMSNFPDTPAVDHRAADFGPNAAYIDELRVRVKQAKEMQAMTAVKVGFQAKDAEYHLDVARREVMTDKSTVPLSKEAFEATKQRYGTGNAAFSDYLDAARMYLDNARMLDEARADYNKALVDLQDATGRTAANLLQDSAIPSQLKLEAMPQEHTHD